MNRIVQRNGSSEKGALGSDESNGKIGEESVKVGGARFQCVYRR